MTTETLSTPQKSEQGAEHAEPRYLRFSLAKRIEHWVFMASFTILGITGLVQKYATSPISRSIVDFLGGIEANRQIHHVAAVVMMIVTVYHIGIVGYRVYVRRVRLTMMPGIDDVRNAIQSLKYNLGLSNERPLQGRYTFEEKAEYWAVVWGTVVMVITGFMMWNPIATTRYLPGAAIPAAKAAHGGEALLAVLAIILWHLYHVIVRTINRSMFNGHLTEEEMVEEHPLELADIKAGTAARPLDPQQVDKRRRIYLPVYSVIAAVLLAGIYWFVTLEETAIATVPPPRENVEVFVPLTPTPLPTPIPTPTPAPTQEGLALTWEEAIHPLFEAKCNTCHGATALGGLNLSTYEGALQGGASGPGIVPNDPAASQILVIQSAGGHPGQLTSEEFTLVQEWVEAGAPQN